MIKERTKKPPKRPRFNYIIILEDIVTGKRYGGTFPAFCIENAEFMASCLNGIIIGEMDEEGNEYYYEDQIDKLNSHFMNSGNIYRRLSNIGFCFLEKNQSLKNKITRYAMGV